MSLWPRDDPHTLHVIRHPRTLEHLLQSARLPAEEMTGQESALVRLLGVVVVVMVVLVLLVVLLLLLCAATSAGMRRKMRRRWRGRGKPEAPPWQPEIAAVAPGRLRSLS